MGKLQKKPLSLFVDIGEGFTEEVPSEMIIDLIFFKLLSLSQTKGDILFLLFHIPNSR